MLFTKETFYQIIQDTWASTLEHRVEVPELSEPSAFEALTVGVEISGAWDGEVLLQCPLPLARLIAGAIFQADQATVGNEEIVDALGEIIHIVAGNMKALLPQPVTVSLPLPLPPGATSAIPIMPCGELICQLALRSNGYPFAVALFERNPTGRTNPLTPIRSQPAKRS